MRICHATTVLLINKPRDTMLISIMAIKTDNINIYIAHIQGYVEYGQIIEHHAATIRTFQGQPLMRRSRNTSFSTQQGLTQ